MRDKWELVSWLSCWFGHTENVFCCFFFCVADSANELSSSHTTQQHWWVFFFSVSGFFFLCVKLFLLPSSISDRSRRITQGIWREGWQHKKKGKMNSTLELRLSRLESKSQWLKWWWKAARKAFQFVFNSFFSRCWLEEVSVEEYLFFSFSFVFLFFS